MAPFYGWGSTASRLQPLRGGSLLFTTKFPVIPGTHFIDLTPKMVKKVIANLDLLKVSGPDCIPVVVLKRCEPELSCILAEFFNKVSEGILFTRLLEGFINGPCI